MDEVGRVFLSYEVPEATPTDSTHFLWSRKQREAIDAERATLQDRGNRSEPEPASAGERPGPWTAV